MSALLTLSSLLRGKVTTVSWGKTEPLVSVTRSLCSISLAVLDLSVITIVPATVEGVSHSTPKEALREQEEESRASAVLDLTTLPHKLRWTMKLEDLSEMNLCSPVVSWLTVSEIPNITFRQYWGWCLFCLLIRKRGKAKEWISFSNFKTFTCVLKFELKVFAVLVTYFSQAILFWPKGSWFSFQFL